MASFRPSVTALLPPRCPLLPPLVLLSLLPPSPGLTLQVLFPLLELVQERTQSASTLDLHASFLIHHTRNTAQKQWAESQVMPQQGEGVCTSTPQPLLLPLQGADAERCEPPVPVKVATAELAGGVWPHVVQVLQCARCIRTEPL